ncbi:MAG: hypothetical protein KJ583_01495 [Nanoarchaeota archaeon]|nr:hypothetical protein [Nanoarchaeota archaeon]MBU1270318.1 hypothetical protein [Nanoarchaeota archaeon]MBU1603967.1 hypothetical protein [Nanoarchaeota archaeon]MBU2443008.1 hypothetical protein [Nanoarchaeota archaeon]
MRLRNKKGSLNLSIEAIVILVMAMAVLGLGLGFIRGLITKGQGQFTTAIDNAELENPATAGNPITLDKTVQVKSGGTGIMKMGFFNVKTQNTVTSAVTNKLLFRPFLYGEIDASGAILATATSDCGKYFNLTTTDLEVGIGKSQGFQIIVKDDKKFIPNLAVPVGEKYLCTVELRGKTDTNKYNNSVNSKQFYVEVVS